MTLYIVTIVLLSLQLSCQPLLELLDSAIRDKEGKQEEIRLQSVVNRLVKMKPSGPDPQLKVEDLPVVVRDLITYSEKG